MENLLKYAGSLHNHTEFSNFRLRDSINTVSGLMDRAIELGHSCIAYTEHDTIANAIDIEEEWDKRKSSNPNFKVIKGNEIYLCRNGLTKENFVRGEDKYYHFILLAKNAEGHKQIREISDRAWMRAWKTGKMLRVPTYYQDLIDIIGKNPGNVIGQTACIGGFLGTHLLAYKENRNEDYFNKIINWCLKVEAIFGQDNFYLEMQPSFEKDQLFVNQQIVRISHLTGIPTVITNDAHYLKKEDIKIQKIFLNSQEGEREVESFYGATYLMSDSEIHQYMDNNIGAEEIQKAYQNIINIAVQCEDYSLKKKLYIPYVAQNTKEPNIIDLDKYKDKVPSLYKLGTSEYSSDRHMSAVILDKFKEQPNVYCNEATYRELETTLDTVEISSAANGVRWSSYLMNVRDFVQTAWNEGGSLVGPARGSGGGFLPLNMMDIIQINPVKEKAPLKYWRFLNPERVSVLDWKYSPLTLEDVRIKNSEYQGKS